MEMACPWGLASLYWGALVLYVRGTVVSQPTYKARWEGTSRTWGLVRTGERSFGMNVWGLPSGGICFSFSGADSANFGPVPCPASQPHS